MFRSNDKLSVKVDVLEFENKKLIEALKFEKQKKNRGKRLNLLKEKDNGPQLFSPSRVQTTREFAAQKKVKKAAQKEYRKKNRHKNRLRRKHGQIFVLH